MDPNHNTGNIGPDNTSGPNGMNLPPQPMSETPMAETAAPSGLQPANNETGNPVRAEAAPAPAAPPPAAAMTWLPPPPTVAVQPAGQPGSADAGQAAVPVPDAADDGDVIEKEWVLKAKQIVDQTKQDPHKQTKELHKFRAEYMKKRYNKVIEPVDE
jgi:hypothetical protein